MKVGKISVLVSRKLTRNFDSWSVSSGATATLDTEYEQREWKASLRELAKQLKDEVNRELGIEKTGITIVIK